MIIDKKSYAKKINNKINYAYATSDKVIARLLKKN